MTAEEALAGMIAAHRALVALWPEMAHRCRYCADVPRPDAHLVVVHRGEQIIAPEPVT